MIDFAEARETKTWTKKFADFYAKPSGIEAVTKELLEKNGFVNKKIIKTKNISTGYVRYSI